MQKKLRKVLPNQKKVVLLQSQNERNGVREKGRGFGKFFERMEWCSKWLKIDFERFASDKVGTDKKEKEIN